MGEEIHVLKSLVKYGTFRWFAPSGSFNWLQRLEGSQYWSQWQLQAYQVEQLRKLLIHANAEIPYYSRLFERIRFRPDEFVELKQLQQIPLLTKQLIRENIDALVSPNASKASLIPSATGGTTGPKMTFFRDRQSVSVKAAALFRCERWAGWDFGDRTGFVWPVTSDYVGYDTWRGRLKNELYRRQLVFASGKWTEATLDDYVVTLKRWRPTILRGFASPLSAVARAVLNQGETLSFLRGVISTGEPLQAGYRQHMERAFGCPIMDLYSCREVGPIAQPCREFGRMHVFSDSNYVELVPNGTIDGSTDGSLHDIVVTDLHNFSMPLIRYQLGDFALPELGTCACGRSLPLLGAVHGRIADTLIAAGGQRLGTGTLHLALVLNAPGEIGQVQIVQHSLEDFTIRLSKKPLPSADVMAHQRREIARLFGANARVAFEIVDEIERETSGKYAFTKCLMRRQPNCNAQPGATET